MKVGLAQIQSTKGDITANITQHLSMCALAAGAGCDLVVFPELSITNYEPGLASGLAFIPGDTRLSVFKEFSANHHISIAIGVPMIVSNGITISLMVYQPQQAVHVQHKQYLHPDELPFVVAGKNEKAYLDIHQRIALAICYEISVPAHVDSLATSGARLFLASVSKTTPGLETAYDQVAAIARRLTVPALMVNSIGPSDNFIAGGRSAAWDAQGNLLQTLPVNEEALLVYDTDTGTCVVL